MVSAVKTLSRLLGRILFTLVFVAVAAVVGWQTWDFYMNEPWTRDGHVRADVVGITPDVSGLVSEVVVADNQVVKKGDVLLRIDRDRFALALKLAEAVVRGQAAALTQAKRDFERYEQLSRDVASQQKVEQAEASQAIAEASYQQALSNRDLARLNLERSEIRAPVNGIISNLALNAGDYVTAGKAVIALVDSDSLRVEGYFEETKLPRIRIGDPVDIHIMGHERRLTGRVESIAGGIEDRERTAGPQLLANVTPAFSWVRLAQRVPVRIALDPPPAGDAPLVAGLSATVSVRRPVATD